VPAARVAAMSGPSAPATSEPRLTSLSHGGGCGCKIAPDVLAELLRHKPAGDTYGNLLVGSETSDDAAVFRLNESQAIVSTTDFFMPIVDDPFDFGRIAATNALSDIYAMGGHPLLALAILGMPIDTLSRETIREILRGGEMVCGQAGIPVAGGHSIDSVEPIYGLAVTGVVDPKLVKRNSGAQPGDVLILGKPLGVGIFSAALKKGLLDEAGYRAMIEVTTQLNLPGEALAHLSGVHAMTDVTGFGLLGHLLEMCRGSSLGARIESERLPLLPGVLELAHAGIATGASTRNWQSCGEQIRLAPNIGSAMRALLTDPQTSGGLLVACAPGEASRVLDMFKTQRFERATVIGRCGGEAPRVDVD
jgi:selenide,water dikinase